MADMTIVLAYFSGIFSKQQISPVMEYFSSYLEKYNICSNRSIQSKFFIVNSPSSHLWFSKPKKKKNKEQKENNTE